MFLTLNMLNCFKNYKRYIHISGLDISGCLLGNSKFTFLSDNLSICQWLSACQVEKIYQNQIQVGINVYNPTSDLDAIYNFNQFNQLFWFSF